MNTISLKIIYGGAPVTITLDPEDHFLGTVCPVHMDDEYAFTLVMNDEAEWKIMREPNGTYPVIDDSLLHTIVRKLKWQLQHAA